MALAAQLGAGAAVAAVWPAEASAQGLAGKHASLIARSVRPPDFETPVALLDSFHHADRCLLRALSHAGAGTPG